MILINLFGVPSAGKSSGAAYIYYKLKSLGINAELIREFAKDKVWEQSKGAFDNQCYIFGEQSFRTSVINNQVQVAITDSPLLLSSFYNSDVNIQDELHALVTKVFNSYDNMNYLVLRDKPYNPAGRFQTEEESNALAEPMKNLLHNNNVKYREVFGNEHGYDSIVDEVLVMLNNVGDNDKRTKKL